MVIRDGIYIDDLFKFQVSNKFQKPNLNDSNIERIWVIVSLWIGLVIEPLNMRFV